MNSLLLRRLLLRSVQRHAPGVRDQCQTFAGLRDVIRPDTEEPDAVEEDARRTKSSSLLADVARGQDVVDLCRVLCVRFGDGVCVYSYLARRRATRTRAVPIVLLIARPRERA